jgi:hypothetical protein
MAKDLEELRSNEEKLRRAVGVSALSAERPSLGEQIVLLRGDLSSLKQQASRLNELEAAVAKVRQAPSEPGLSWTNLTSFERESLKTSWRRYQKSEPRAAELAERIKIDPRFELIRVDLLTELPQAVLADERLKAACGSLLEPVKEFYNLCLRVSDIPDLLGDVRPEDDPRRDIVRMREKVALLAVLRHGQGGRERLAFDLEKWIREQFLSFADLFLRVYQQARCDGSAAGLDEGYAIVCRVLRVANLEPIEIDLGQTRFDSSQHIGRSTVSRPEMPDGTIAGVVKNGFRQVGGQVVQQPEVIVNRA